MRSGLNVENHTCCSRPVGNLLMTAAVDFEPVPPNWAISVVNSESVIFAGYFAIFTVPIWAFLKRTLALGTFLRPIWKAHTTMFAVANSLESVMATG